MAEAWDMDGFTTELLLKVPKDKPPVIAVVFTKVKEACEMNEDLINEFAELPFYIRFKNLSSKGINFEIASEKLKGTRSYKDVKYDKTKLENFLFITRSAKYYTFTHLLYDFDRYFPISTYSKYKKFELKVERVYFT